MDLDRIVKGSCITAIATVGTAIGAGTGYGTYYAFVESPENIALRIGVGAFLGIMSTCFAGASIPTFIKGIGQTYRGIIDAPTTMEDY